MYGCSTLPLLSNLCDFTEEANSMTHHDSNVFHQKLREKLDAAAANATTRVLAGEFDEAEQMIQEIDRDIYGWLAMARMYIASIAKLGGEEAAIKDRERILTMFERAVALRERAYPMPHTQDEAEAYDRGRAQDRGQVVQEIGFDPSQWPNAKD